jgi:hypothetical protein
MPEVNQERWQKAEILLKINAYEAAWHQRLDVISKLCALASEAFAEGFVAEGMSYLHYARERAAAHRFIWSNVENKDTKYA